MRLSEAIILGSVSSRQGFGPHSMLTSHPTKCAMGSALLAVGIQVVDEGGTELLAALWPWTMTEINPPVQLKEYKGGVVMPGTRAIHGIIWRLNDMLKWTRPQIAAWVATQELLYDPEVMNQPVTLESTLVSR